MSEKTFKNELSRALNRPDVDHLTSVLSVYHHWSVNHLSEKEWSDELDVWFGADLDPDLGLALVMLAAATYDNADFLGLVAAGLLEDLLRKPSDEFLDRIVSEARKTARLRWMLDVIFRHAIECPKARSAIEQVVGDMDCDGPLPPRPWA